MKRLDVSEVANSRDGFLHAYKKFGSNLPPEWEKKRENFIKRHIVQFENHLKLGHNSYRHYLSIRDGWALSDSYLDPILQKHFKPSSLYKNLSTEDKFKKFAMFSK